MSLGLCSLRLPRKTLSHWHKDPPRRTVVCQGRISYEALHYWSYMSVPSRDPPAAPGKNFGSRQSWFRPQLCRVLAV